MYIYVHSCPKNYVTAQIKTNSLYGPNGENNKMGVESHAKLAPKIAAMLSFKFSSSRIVMC